MESIEWLGFEESAIHNVKTPPFRQQMVEHVDLVHFSIADMNRTGYRACPALSGISPQIEQSLQSDSGLGLAEQCPRKHGKSQIYGGGVETINRPFQIGAKALVGENRPGDANQTLSEVDIDWPVSCCVGISESVSRQPKPNTEVIKPVVLCSKTRLDVQQAFPIFQLSEGRTKKLIEA